MGPWLTVGAHALVFDRSQRLLLTRRADRDQWCPPGGAVEPGEAPWEAAVRETREETGYDISVESLVGLYYHRERTDLICVFRCSAVGGAPSCSREVRELGFFSVAELPDGLPAPWLEHVHEALDGSPLAHLRVT